MSNEHYPEGLEAFANGEIAYLTDDIHCVLLDNTVSFNAAHQYLDDVNSGQVDMSPALTTKTSTLGVLDADDPVFTALTGADCEAWVLIKYTGSAATSPLIAWFDTKADTTAFLYSPNGADFTLNFDAAGIMEI